MVRNYDSLDLWYLRSDTNQGPASARNAGIRLASNEIVAFTDNDCMISPDWGNILYSELRCASRRVVGIGGRVEALRRDSLFGQYHDFHQILNPPIFPNTCLYLVTANCCYRRDEILQVGGFDERLPFPGGEDPGLSFKLLGKGYVLGYSRAAIVYHDFRSGFVDFVRTFYRYGSGNRDQVDRYAPRVALDKLGQIHANDEN